MQLRYVSWMQFMVYMVLLFQLFRMPFLECQGKHSLSYHIKMFT